MQNRESFRAGMMACVFCFSMLVGICSGEEFSADMETTTKAGLVKAKVFFSKEKIRMEIAGAVTITRQDKNALWVLLPAQKMYIEQAMRLDQPIATSEKLPGEVERKLLGKEEVEGRSTEKYRIVYEVGGKKESVLTWIAPDLGVPLKSEAEDGKWKTVFKNLKPGKQPDSLFELPEGYKKLGIALPAMP